MNQYEITKKHFEDASFANSENRNINVFIGRTALQLIMNNALNPSQKIYEYDTQVIDKSIIFQLVDRHYLLVNKFYLKEFYSYWQTSFVNGSRDNSDLMSFCILLVNPNFASAWSCRKTTVMVNYLIIDMS